jgi:hypothetical protein
MELVRTIKPASEAWITMRGTRPLRETLYWIMYMQSKCVRLAYWQDRGCFGAGFYSVTELHTPESEVRQVFRVELAMYLTPDQFQKVDGEHSIEQ